LPVCAIDFHHFGSRFKQHYACFDCRKAFKAGDEFVPVKVLTPRGMRLDRVPRKVPCPDCGQIMARMGRLFRAPKRSKVKAWAALAARFGGPRRHLGAPFNEPWRREDRLRRERAATQAAAARRSEQRHV
jgi:DNA-directed RNA polymerase subunit RPC12/RpoP